MARNVSLVIKVYSPLLAQLQKMIVEVVTMIIVIFALAGVSRHVKPAKLDSIGAITCVMLVEKANLHQEVLLPFPNALIVRI